MIDTSSVKLAPSLLAADFAHLADQVREAEEAGADRLHIDVMDGHFVPNLALSPHVVRALRKVSALPIEVHLMVEDPNAFIPMFAEAGATRQIVHVECNPHLHRSAGLLKSVGSSAGVVEGLPELIHPVHERVRNHAFAAFVEDFKVTRAALGDDAGVVGAAALARANVTG